MKELSENTSFEVSIKTLIAVAFAIASAIAMYYSLKQDIEIAKELPKPNITRTEYDLKDQMIREAIIQTQEDVQEIGRDVKKIDERLFEIQNK